MFETKNKKSQYQSHSLRPEENSLGLSLKNETAPVKSQPWSQQKQIVIEQTIFPKVEIWD